MTLGSIGRKLLVVRKSRGLSLEDVAFHTRIPVARLREMENDDLSNFASITYARSFLRLYSRYLDVDISEHLDEFSTSAMAAAAGHEFVQSAHAGGSVFGHGASPRSHRRSGLLVATTTVIGIIAVIAVRNLVAGGNDAQTSEAPVNGAPSPSATAPEPPSPAKPAAGRASASVIAPAPTATAAEAPHVPLRQAPTKAAVHEDPEPLPTLPDPAMPPPVEPSPITPEKDETESASPSGEAPPKAVPVPEDDPQ